MMADDFKLPNGDCVSIYKSLSQFVLEWEPDQDTGDEPKWRNSLAEAIREILAAERAEHAAEVRAREDVADAACVEIEELKVKHAAEERRVIREQVEAYESLEAEWKELTAEVTALRADIAAKDAEIEL